MIIDLLAKEESISLLEVNPGLVIWTFIVFGIVLFLLHRFAWGPITLALDTRASKIHRDLESAKEIKEDAEKKLSSYLSQLDNLKKEGQKIIEESKLEAEKISSKILSDAKLASENEVSKANKEILDSKNKAINEIESLAINLAMDIVTQIIGHGLKVEDQKKLIDESISKFKGLINSNLN